MENASDLQIDENKQREGETFWAKISLFFKGFVLPCFSRKYYREVSKKPLIFAIGFFIVFGLFIAGFSMLQLGLGMGSMNGEIRKAYASGAFPTIVIEDGIARTDQAQQYFISEERTFFGIDTTGETTAIDTQSYSQGFLLTRTEIHFVNEDGYQTLPLADLNTSFGNPIVIDEAKVLTWWSALTVIIMVFMFLGIFLVFTFYWFIVILLLALVIWGFVTIKRRGYDFSPIVVIGLFAYVPATYLDFILNKLGLEFCNMQILILLFIWVLVLRWFLKDQAAIKELNPAEQQGPLID